MSRVKDRRAHRARKAGIIQQSSIRIHPLGFRAPQVTWDIESVYPEWRVQYGFSHGPTRSPILGRYNCTGEYRMPKCSECGGDWSHKPNCSQIWCSNPLTPVTMRVALDMLRKAEAAHHIMVQTLKQEGWTQHIPGWDGVLVSPDGETTIET